MGLRQTDVSLASRGGRSRLIFSLYRGPIYAGAATLVGILAVVGIVWYFRFHSYDDAWFSLLVLFVSMLGGIASLLLIALSYIHWMPKWERDEKRTGHIPGEEG